MKLKKLGRLEGGHWRKSIIGKKKRNWMFGWHLLISKLDSGQMRVLINYSKRLLRIMMLDWFICVTQRLYMLLARMRWVHTWLEVGKNWCQAAEEVYKKTVKKFSVYPESWLKFAEFYLKKDNLKAARELLPRSLKSLDKAHRRLFRTCERQSWWIDVEMTQKMAVLEFRHGDAERGKTLFEGIIDRYPKKLDVWSVYIDQVAKAGDIQSARGLFERLLQLKQNAKRAKWVIPFVASHRGNANDRFLFKKWLNIEVRIGDAAGQERAKTRAREWVAANAKPEEDEDEEMEEASDEE
jgi:tetratricopeptide (TPR) repeat protein